MRLALLRVSGALLPGGPTLQLGQAVLWVAVMWAAVALIRPDLLRAEALVFDNDHGLLSMEIAMSRAYCDAPSKISPSVRITYEVRDRPELANVPLQRLAIERAGSLVRYCNSIGSPVANNENSLMWVMSWMLRLGPELSFAGLAQGLHTIRLAGLVLFSATLMVAGCGALLAGAATVIALSLLHELQAQAYTAYPFLLVLVLVTTAVYVLASNWRFTRGTAGSALVAFSVGAWTSFAGNIRTSHLPVYLVMASLFFAINDRMGARPARSRLRVVLMTVLFAVGYAAFHYVAIERHLGCPRIRLP